MAIYRGPGGSGDATTDAASQATVATTKAAEAAASASAASSSATTAATEATNASTSASNSATSATASASSAAAASTSETNAATSASNASTSASSAATSATNAATSETNAANSATAAATSATNAATSASNASTSETNAASSATSSATSATNAATSETNAALSYDSFDDRYLGAKASAPLVDNDGDALLTGALYWNTSINQLFVWDGSAWDQAAFSISGSVTSFNTRTGVVTLSASDVNTALGSDAVLDSDIGSTVQAFATVLSNTTASYTTAEETKLAGIEASATADQTGAEIKAAYELEANAFTDAQFTKLAGIEASADLTDATNVTAAGALMDSELTSEASVKALDQGVATTDSPSFAGLTTTDNINFGDNDKAIFGAGSDLQIYHNGANSYIDDTGTGNLFIKASNNLILESATGENYLAGVANGSVTLYHDSSPKIATTSTGVNVTGTVTADGLTVDTDTLAVDSTNNRVGIGTTSPTEPLDVVGTIGSNVSSTGDFNFRATSTGGGQYLIYPDDATTANPTWLHQTNSSEDQAFVIGGVERVRINSSGNVGIGTASPVKRLTISGASNGNITTLTDAATITPNLDSSDMFTVTLGGNRTLANPSNIDAGQTGSIFIVQDGTGSRTLAWGSYWDFAGGTAPTLSTAAGAVDRVDFIVRTSTSIHAVFTANYS